MEINELTFKVIGCAMNVHSTLGNGFQEVIYQRCLAIELKEAGIKFRREQPQQLSFKGRVVGERRVDFVIEDKLSVELKACITLENVHLAQAKNYLVAYGFRIGLLINFGAVSLQYKKLFNNGHSYSNKNNPENPENPRNPDSDKRP